MYPVKNKEMYDIVLYHNFSLLLLKRKFQYGGQSRSYSCRSHPDFSVHVAQCVNRCDPLLTLIKTSSVAGMVPDPWIWDLLPLETLFQNS